MGCCTTKHSSKIVNDPVPPLRPCPPLPETESNTNRAPHNKEQNEEEKVAQEVAEEVSPKGKSRNNNELLYNSQSTKQFYGESQCSQGDIFGEVNPPATVNVVMVSRVDEATHDALVSTLEPVSEDLSPDRKPVLDLMVFQAPDRKSCDLKRICEYFYEKGLYSDIEKAWVAFRWVTQNITHEANLESDTEKIYKKGKAGCYGFSAIFKELASKFGVCTETVNGFVRNVEWDPEKLSEEPNHTWNAVKIAGEWKLVDAMYGAGKFGNNGEYIKEFSEFYFCTSPHKLIRTHFPVDPKWQMLDTPLSRECANKLLPLGPVFYEAGLVKPEPDQSVVKIDGKALFKLMYDPKANPDISATLISGNTEVKGAVFIQKLPGQFNISLAINQAGQYDLSLFVLKDDNYTLACKYRTICNTNAKTVVKYPEQYKAFNEVDAILYSPLEGLLDLDFVYNFKLKVAENVEQVAVVVGEQWIYLVKKHDSFEGEVEITSSEVCVYAKTDDSETFTALLLYQVNTLVKCPENETVRTDRDTLSKNGIKDYPTPRLIMCENNKGLLKFKYNETQKTKFLTTLTNSQGLPLENYTFIQYQGPWVNILLALPEKGDYSLQVFAHNKEDEEKCYNFCLGYVARGTGSTPGKKFVYMYPMFEKLGGLVHEPKEGVIKKGSKTKFRLQIKKCEELVLVPQKGRKVNLYKETDEIYETKGEVAIKEKGELILYAVQKGKNDNLKALLKYDVEQLLYLYLRRHITYCVQYCPYRTYTKFFLKIGLQFQYSKITLQKQDCNKYEEN
eukprot:TRINITY_DN71007_c1_g1_i1.p1 TRINITY_DN71007_c1_g1~~TRINITY_DN71007_c1_g1_i1.p1  ORF type:complete len:787 (-),score=72.44 TRINITY_DN71007_c1_g1_i1:4092-6452(-)